VWVGSEVAVCTQEQPHACQSTFIDIEEVW